MRQGRRALHVQLNILTDLRHAATLASGAQSANIEQSTAKLLLMQDVLILNARKDPTFLTQQLRLALEDCRHTVRDVSRALRVLN